MTVNDIFLSSNEAKNCDRKVVEKDELVRCINKMDEKMGTTLEYIKNNQYEKILIIFFILI